MCAFAGWIGRAELRGDVRWMGERRGGGPAAMRKMGKMRRTSCDEENGVERLDRQGKADAPGAVGGSHESTWQPIDACASRERRHDLASHKPNTRKIAPSAVGWLYAS